MEKELIGVVTKPQALKGQFRVKPALNNLKLYKNIAKVEIDGKEYDVESVSLRDAFVVFKIAGIDNCNDAENLRNKDVYSEIAYVLESGNDITGYSVQVDGNEIGKIVAINNYGAKDILSISGSNEIMLPLIDGLVESQDNEKKIVVLSKNIFEQVAVYED